MRILIACEESQEVCKAFRDKGHEAYSCDTIDCSGGHPEWHIQDDVLNHLDDGWDIMIAFPPCTYLARVAIQHNTKPGRLKLRDKAIDFFKKLQNAQIEKIAIENSRPQKYVWENVGRWDQVIQPFYFGDPFSKAACLWLKNLPKLKHSKENTLFEEKTHVNKGEFYINTNGRTNAKWYSCSKKSRSKTFPGIAKAMADQWG